LEGCNLLRLVVGQFPVGRLTNRVARGLRASLATDGIFLGGREVIRIGPRPTDAGSIHPMTPVAVPTAAVAQVGAGAHAGQHHAEDDQTYPIFALRAARVEHEASLEHAEFDDDRAHARASEAEAKQGAGREQWYIRDMGDEVEYPVACH
jgi:hypothetical protein